MEKCDNVTDVVGKFTEENRQDGLRVFVAGGSRSGNDKTYVEEAYNLGSQIADMDFKLDFGLSSSGIMGAVARGVLDKWKQKNCAQGNPIQGITTKEYYSLYESDEILGQIEDVIVAQTLEERKQKLLNADFIVFAPGGVGTLDELAYDCVAMQDGFLKIKPFILYNINGFFHHLVEYIKAISLEGFADPMPFIVVDNSRELGIVFRLLKQRYKKGNTTQEVYAATRQLMYELPYFVKSTESGCSVEDICQKIKENSYHGSSEERQELANDIERAYLEKEIERMYDRLAKTGRDTAIVSDKLSYLKKRKQENYEFCPL